MDQTGIGPYLAGTCFSDDLAWRPEIIGHQEPRGDLLTAWVAGQRVLHVGFADHVPLIGRRVADGSWLHARLTRSASDCQGIDINAEGVAQARELGFSNVHQLDIFSDAAPAMLAAWSPDMVLVPDVIEHLPDPAAFLRRLVQCLPDAEFVVSVPNGLSLRNTVHAAGGVERINTDHRAWFSPFTLSKVLADAGLACRSLHGCNVSAPGTLKGWALHAVVRGRPIWADVLLACARAAVNASRSR